MDAELFKQVLAAAKDMTLEQMQELHEARNEISFTFTRKEVDGYFVNQPLYKPLTDDEWDEVQADLRGSWEYWWERLEGFLEDVRDDIAFNAEKDDDEDDDDSDDDDE